MKGAAHRDSRILAGAGEGRLRVLVVDDEPLARDVLRRLLATRDDLELVAEACSGVEALEILEQSRSVDLVLLDIQMPELDGFETLERWSTMGEVEGRPATVVFVTAYSRYAVRAFETQALDYLVKPVTPDRFHRAMDRVMETRRTLRRDEVQRLLRDALVTAPDRLLVKKGRRIVPVSTADIDWIEASGDYVRLHCDGESHLVERTLNEMERLLEPRGFRRIHRSALVNRDRIGELAPLGSGRWELRLGDGTPLVVSRTYAARFKLEFL